MTTGVRGDHLARLQSDLKRSSDRIYELERRLKLKQTNPRSEKVPVTPLAVVSRSSNLSCAHGAPVDVPWTLLRENAGGTHWSSSSPTLLSCQRSGLYMVSCHVGWTQLEYDTTAQLLVYRGSTLIFSDTRDQPGVTTNLAGNTIDNSGSALVRIAAGQQLKVTVLHLNTNNSPRSLQALGHSPELSMIYLAP